MSQENVDVAQRGLDAFDRRDKAAWLALNAPEIEWFANRADALEAAELRE